jgi:tRNA dimethylallyltransferase
MPERAWLHARCEARFDAMLAEGALDEARAVAARALPGSLPGMKALGAPELLDHLAGRLTLDEAAARAKTATRRYAKRQITWARTRMADWTRLAPGDIEGALAAAAAAGVASR